MRKADTDSDVEPEIRAIGYMLDSVRERVDDESVDTALVCARLCLDEALLRGDVSLAETAHEPEE